MAAWLLLALCGSPFTPVLHAQTNGQFEGFHYTIENEAVTITGYTGPETDVAVPGIINTLPVTKMGTTAFQDLKEITSVSLPSSIIDIGPGCFANCYKLAKINLPEGITIVRGATFWGCGSLDEITIPHGVERIGLSAFLGCGLLRKVNIPETVTRIEESAFSSCRNLSSIVLPQNLLKIEPFTFFQCSELNNVILPKNLQEIKSSAFEHCRNIPFVTIPSSVSRIDSYAYRECSKLFSVVFLGDAPDFFALSAFEKSNKKNRPKLYYYEGSNGFTSPDWNSYSTQPLLKPLDLIETGVQEATWQGDVFSVALDGEHGHIYELQRSQQLGGIEKWESIAMQGPLLSKNMITLIDNHPPIDQGYYRVVQSIP